MEDVKYQWFWSPLENVGPLVEMNSEDVAFCKALTTAGHVIHVDTKVCVGHQKMLIF